MGSWGFIKRIVILITLRNHSIERSTQTDQDGLYQIAGLRATELWPACRACRTDFRNWRTAGLSVWWKGDVLINMIGSKHSPGRLALLALATLLSGGLCPTSAQVNSGAQKKVLVLHLMRRNDIFPNTPIVFYWRELH